MSRGRTAVVLSAALALALALSTCRGASLPPLVAPSSPGAGPFPVWAAVCDDSTFAVWGDASLALELPVLLPLAELVPLVVAKHGLDYKALGQALGFDPLMDLDEVFITDAGLDGEGGMLLVVLLRYEEGIEDVDVVLELVGAASGGPAVERNVIAGREVFFLDEPRVAVALLDGTTLAVLRGFDTAAARAWMESATTSSEVRGAAARVVDEHSRHPHLGPADRRFLSAWFDLDAYIASGGTLHVAENMITTGSLSSWLRAETAVMHASYVDGELALLSHVIFPDAQAAHVAAASIEESFADAAQAPAVPLLGDTMNEVARRLEVEAEEEVLLGRWAIPESTLVKLASLLKFFVGLAVIADGMAAEGGEDLPSPLPFPRPGI